MSEAEPSTALVRDSRGNVEENASVLAIIERASRDPSVDLDKMERLIAMRDRMMAERARAEFAVAMAAMQAELPTISERGGIKDRSGNVQSTYALWEDINRAIIPVLQRHGFALTFRNTNTPTSISVTGVLSHRGGHREETTITLPVDVSGNKNAVQGVASSVSYGKRYTTGLLLNITSCGEDDDGSAAGAPPPAPAMPRRASEVAKGEAIDAQVVPEKPAPSSAVYLIESVTLKEGVNATTKKPWKVAVIRTSDEAEFATFSESIWTEAERLQKAGAPAQITYEPGPAGKAPRAVAIAEVPEGVGE
jgi:hypothetical protein